jgi:hypothetical protein
MPESIPLDLVNADAFGLDFVAFRIQGQEDLLHLKFFVWHDELYLDAEIIIIVLKLLSN